jgi:mannitol/fructose-specific phosphotransferase system IIA component (Ntr-type)
MKIYSMLKPELIKLNCTAKTTEGVLKELLYVLKVRAKISTEESIFIKLMEREGLGSTSIGNYSAVPHTKLKELKEPVISIGTSKDGIVYNETDKEPVHFIILILSPNYSPIIHLQILAAAASLIKKSKKLIDEILAAQSPEELISIIQKYETSND